MGDISSRADPFEDYLDEDAIAEWRKCSKRHLRAERQAGQGPPFLKIDRRVLYPLADFRAWLVTITRQPARAKRRAEAEGRAT